MGGNGMVEGNRAILEEGLTPNPRRDLDPCFVLPVSDALTNEDIFDMETCSRGYRRCL